MKMKYLVVGIVLMLVGGRSTSAHPQTGGANTYNGIPVEVVGLPYGYKDICGNHSLDYIIEKAYKSVSTWQASSFVNFTIDKFVFNFSEKGSLLLSTVYSYDQTPAANGASYPAQSGKIPN